MKVLTRFSPYHHAGRAATPIRASLSGSCPTPCGSEQASGIIIDGPGAEGRLFGGRPADDHWMNSPSSGQHTAHYSPVIIAPFVAWGRRGSLPLFFWSGGREAALVQPKSAIRRRRVTRTTAMMKTTMMRTRKKRTKTASRRSLKNRTKEREQHKPFPAS